MHGRAAKVEINLKNSCFIYLIVSWECKEQYNFFSVARSSRYLEYFYRFGRYWIEKLFKSKSFNIELNNLHQRPKPGEFFTPRLVPSRKNFSPARAESLFCSPPCLNPKKAFTRLDLSFTFAPRPVPIRKELLRAPTPEDTFVFRKYNLSNYTIQRKCE